MDTISIALLIFCLEIYERQLMSYVLYWTITLSVLADSNSLGKYLTISQYLYWFPLQILITKTNLVENSDNEKLIRFVEQFS